MSYFGSQERAHLLVFLAKAEVGGREGPWTLLKEVSGIPYNRIHLFLLQILAVNGRRVGIRDAVW